jgi:hypothetical protein
MSNDGDPDMNAQTTTHVPLPRMDYHYGEGSAMSFRAGALIATTLCAFGYLLYNWLGS